MSAEQWGFVIGGMIALVYAIVLTIRHTPKALLWYILSAVSLFGVMPAGAGLLARKALDWMGAAKTWSDNISFIIFAPVFLLICLLGLLFLPAVLFDAVREHSWADFGFALVMVLVLLAVFLGTGYLWWSATFG